MIQLYKQEWQNFRTEYARIFYWILGIGIGISILSYFVLIQQPELAMEKMDEFSKKLLEQVEMFGGSLEGSNTEIFLFILKNNLFVSMIIFLTGFIPFVILPVLISIGSFMSVGVMLAGINVMGGSALKALFTSILPHGVIEITGLVFVISISIYMSLHITKKLFSSNRSNIMLSKVIVQSLKSFVFVVVPTITIAAVIEGYVTPAIINLFYT